MPNLRDIRFGNAADGDDGKSDGATDLLEHGEAARGITRLLGHRTKDGSKADIVGPSTFRLLCLFRGMGRNPDKLIPHDPSSSREGEVLLPQVNTIRPAGQSDIDSVVYNEEATRLRGLPPHLDGQLEEFLRGLLFDPELDH